MQEKNDIVEDENKIDTVIADDIEFRGKILFNKSLKIKGIFEGKIETDSHLIIGQEAKVSADITAGVVSVNGVVHGKIKATKYIELFNKSQTNCDLVTPNIYIEKGSLFNGTCVMSNEE